MPLTMLPSRRLFGGLLIARKRFIESFQPENLLCEDSSAHISTFGPVGNEMRSSRLPPKLYKGTYVQCDVMLFFRSSQEMLKIVSGLEVGVGLVCMKGPPLNAYLVHRYSMFGQALIIIIHLPHLISSSSSSILRVSSCKGMNVHALLHSDRVLVTNHPKSILKHWEPFKFYLRYYV